VVGGRVAHRDHGAGTITAISMSAKSTPITTIAFDNGEEHCFRKKPKLLPVAEPDEEARAPEPEPEMIAAAPLPVSPPARSKSSRKKKPPKRRFDCPSCATPLKARIEEGTTAAECGNCGTIFDLEMPEGETEAAVAPKKSGGAKQKPLYQFPCPSCQAPLKANFGEDDTAAQCGSCGFTFDIELPTAEEAQGKMPLAADPPCSTDATNDAAAAVGAIPASDQTESQTPAAETAAAELVASAVASATEPESTSDVAAAAEEPASSTDDAPEEEPVSSSTADASDEDLVSPPVVDTPVDEPATPQLAGAQMEPVAQPIVDPHAVEASIAEEIASGPTVITEEAASDADDTPMVPTTPMTTDRDEPAVAPASPQGKQSAVSIGSIADLVMLKSLAGGENTESMWGKMRVAAKSVSIFGEVRAAWNSAVQMDEDDKSFAWA